MDMTIAVLDRAASYNAQAKPVKPNMPDTSFLLQTAVQPNKQSSVSCSDSWLSHEKSLTMQLHCSVMEILCTPHKPFITATNTTAAIFSHRLTFVAVNWLIEFLTERKFSENSIPVQIFLTCNLSFGTFKIYIVCKLSSNNTIYLDLMCMLEATVW